MAQIENKDFFRQKNPAGDGRAPRPGTTGAGHDTAAARKEAISANSAAMKKPDSGVNPNAPKPQPQQETAKPQPQQPMAEARTQSQAGKPQPQQPTAEARTQSQAGKPQPQRMTAERRRLMQQCAEAAETMRKTGMPALAKKIESLMARMRDTRFTVAFVGEFSRGKSTLINSLLGADVLPASGLPTTALITRIGYGAKPGILLLNPDGSVRESLPLDKQSMKALSIDNFSAGTPRKEEGTAAVKVPSPWLGKYGIVLLDTPGAGDLGEGRMKSVAKALLASEGAVITIDATQPLSLSEQSFIKQRVVGVHTPFLVVAVTKMDLVPEAEREAQMDYIIKLMRGKGWNFPVIIAGKGVRLPGSKYDAVNGTDKLHALISGWVVNPARASRLDAWLRANVGSVLDMALGAWNDQRRIAEARGSEHARLKEERAASLQGVRPKWEELRSGVMERRKNALEEFDSRMANAAKVLTERLQHEMERFPDPKKWVEREYNFRVRHELAALSQSLDGWALRTVAKDMAWLNGCLQKQFRTALQIEQRGLAPLDENAARTGGENLGLEDLDKSRKTASVATIALGLGGAVALASMGGFIPLATMGFSGGAGLFTRSMFEKKTERQREEVRALIDKEIPGILREASADSRARLAGIYEEILREAAGREQEWFALQSDMIARSKDAEGEEMSARVEEALKRVTAIRRQFGEGTSNN